MWLKVVESKLYNLWKNRNDFFSLNNIELYLNDAGFNVRESGFPLLEFDV